MKKSRSWLEAILLNLFILAVIYLLVFNPIPFFIESPGQAFSLDEMVEVNNEQSNETGDFYITTVSYRQATPLSALTSLFPYRDLVREADLVGEGENLETYDIIQQYYMESSANTAIQVALEAADETYELHYNGIYVLQVLEESDFYETLQVGDTVKAVDGHRFESSQEFINYVSNLGLGDSVDITFERDGELHTVNGDLIQLESGVPGIGIGLVDNTSIETEIPIEINSGQIGGPSAGLMFSLQIYNQLVEENIRNGYEIAGTGTIAADGTVGRIGGIAKKVVAADEAGVDYFFVPNDYIPPEALKIEPNLQTNYEEALEAAAEIETDMEVIPVENFQDAIDFLEQLREEEASFEPNKLLAFNGWDDGLKQVAYG